MIINPVNGAGIGVAIAAGKKANGPVVTFDRSGGKGDFRVKVGFDNYGSGFDAELVVITWSVRQRKPPEGGKIFLGTIVLNYVSL